MTNATKVMIIRHAEKPTSTPLPLQGVRFEGEQDPESLIVRGWQRAGALVPFFTRLNDPSIITPQFLYAARVGHHSHSKRPQETIHPLSERIDLNINTQFGEGKYEAMVDSALACEGVVLICWQHEEIPAMAQLIPGAQGVPTTWPGSRYDVVWVFDRVSDTEYTFSQVPQLLLLGDLPGTIS